MDQSKLKVLRSFLTWFLTFYLVFWGYQTFIVKPEVDPTVPVELADIELNLTTSKVVLGNPLLLHIKNNQSDAWEYADMCADGNRLEFSRLLIGKTFPLEYGSEICAKNLPASLTVPAGESVSLSLGTLNGQLFSEAGNYQVALPESVEVSSEATNFIYKEPGFFRKGFRTIVTTPLFNLLVFFVDKIPGNILGWAIVAMTLIVRIILVAPNQKAMKSQRKLQKLQPEIASLKKKHKDNQQAVAMATMALYKKHKINPMSSCLPIFLQMPFLLGIYFVVRDGITPHFAQKLYNFQSGFDLSVVDNYFFGLDLSVPDIFVLPVIVGVAQFFAMKLAMIHTKKKTDNKPAKKGNKKGPDMADQMQQMQKMMLYVFPFMIAFFTATFPAGVGIYWLTSTVFGIAQQRFVNWQLDRPKVKRKD